MHRKARVTVMLKKAVLDPQGQAVKDALQKLGFVGMHEVRVGKTIEITLDEKAQIQKSDLEQMANKLLANPVMEDFIVEIEQ